MVDRVIFLRIAVCGLLLGLVACASEPALPDGGAAQAAGNFAGALVSEDYDEAFSYLTDATQTALGSPETLEARFGTLCPVELTQYQVQAQPTEQAGIVVNTGTLTCADGSEVSVLIVVENVGPDLWLVIDFQLDAGTATR